MSKNSKNTPLSPSGWNFRGINLSRRYRSGFSELKKSYKNELLNTGKHKFSSRTLTKEEKRKIKEKIKAQITRQYIKKLIALIIAIIIMTVLLIYAFHIF